MPTRRQQLLAFAREQRNHVVVLTAALVLLALVVGLLTGSLVGELVLALVFVALLLLSRYGDRLRARLGGAVGDVDAGDAVAADGTDGPAPLTPSGR